MNDIYNRDEKWLHGTSLWKKFQRHHAYYCCKYVFKDMNDPHAVAKFNMSKKPPLGDAYFRWLASQYVNQGLAPQEPIYKFREVRERNGNMRRFRMRNKTRQNFIEHYLSEWRKADPFKEVPRSPLIEEYLDKNAAEEIEAMEWENFELAMLEAQENRKHIDEKYPNTIQPGDTAIYADGRLWRLNANTFLYKGYPGDPKKVDPTKLTKKPPKPSQDIPFP